jgi:hypothetical protein
MSADERETKPLEGRHELSIPVKIYGLIWILAMSIELMSQPVYLRVGFDEKSYTMYFNIPLTSKG